MSRTLRFRVPLNTMCSRKWLMPFCAGRFVARTDIGPDPERNGTDVRDRFADHPDAVVQRGLAVVSIFDLTVCGEEERVTRGMEKYTHSRGQSQPGPFRINSGSCLLIVG